MEDLFQNDKIYFMPGDLVTIKHDLPNKPVMLVKSKEAKALKTSDGSHFLGMRCIWFDAHMVLHENVFNTKDLKHI